MHVADAAFAGAVILACRLGRSTASLEAGQQKAKLDAHGLPLKVAAALLDYWCAGLAGTQFGTALIKRKRPGQ